MTEDVYIAVQEIESAAEGLLGQAQEIIDAVATLRAAMGEIGGAA